MKLWKVLLLGVFFCWALPAKAIVSTLVADTRSGFVIEANEATVPQAPASLTKLMTLYLTFGALDNGILTMDDELPISEQAAAQPRSKIDVVPGETITVREAILALIIKSANDVAVVLAEALGKNEEQFADLMTRTAKGLGLKDTVFKNASGLHADGQVSTARDMGILAMALISHYPQYYSLFATPSFQYKGKTYYSHNTVLQQYEGAEGLKTGFVSAVGYNIVSTAKKDKTRLVSVVLGEDSSAKRDIQAIRLLDKGFRQVEIQKKAEAEGRLKSAFNPLNRKAVVATPPIRVFLPFMKACWNTCRKKKQMAMRRPAARPISQPITLSDGIEQGDNWSIQVGAFEGEKKARQIAEKARSILGADEKEIQTPRANNQFFRSRIQGFTQNDAKKACQQLLKGTGWECFPVAPRG